MQFWVSRAKAAVMSPCGSSHAANGVLDVACLTEDRRLRRLDLVPTTADLDFLPLPALPSFLAIQESRLLAVLHLRFGLFEVLVDRPRSLDCHRGRDWRGPET
jgi:hypothetical protein